MGEAQEKGSRKSASGIRIGRPATPLVGVALRCDKAGGADGRKLFF